MLTNPNMKETLQFRLSHGIFGGPLLGILVVYIAVSLVNARNLGHQRVIGIRIAQQRTNREQHLGYGESRRPLRPQYIKANASIAVYVRMVNAGGECDLKTTKFMKYDFSIAQSFYRPFTLGGMNG